MQIKTSLPRSVASRSSHRSRLLCRSSSAIRRRLQGSQRQPAATAAAAARSDDASAVHDKEQQEPLEALIADVLNANKAQLQRPSDLLSLIDASGHGISTLVRRSWDTTSVRLALEGSWSSCPEARKMAMLAVYQERLVARAAGLLRTLHWVVAQQPALLDAAVVQQVEALAAADDINPAVQVLMVPQLTLLAAGLYPWPVLAQLVETAVATAQQTLLSKPPYSYSESKHKAAVQQLQWVEASLCRGAALARLRALLIQQGRLQHWQQQADTAAAAAGAALQGLTAEQAYHEWWKQQPPQLQEQQAFLGSAAAGRPLLASFHSRDSSKQWQYQQAPGLAATAAASAAAGGGAWDVAAAAREQQQLCCSISQLTERVRRLKQELGGTEAALGVLPEVQAAHRSALLDLLVTWADASHATQGSPESPGVQARVAISSIEHDRLLRRIALEATGAETRVLRQLARSKGREFLAHFSPTVGNPFGSTPEWDYFRDCPGVFARFVVDPPTDTATLTFKQQAVATVAQQQPAAADGDVEVVLSGPELQQLQQQLLLVLAGSNAAAAAAGSSSSNGSRVVQLRPISGSSLAPVSSRARGGAAAGGLELLLGGSVAAVLQPVHVVSLVTVFDDLGGQLPQQYSTSRQMQAVQVTPAPAWGAALQAATSAVNSAARAAAGAALLALPLIAMARPFRTQQQQQQQQQLPPAATAAAVGASATAAGSTSPAAAAAAAAAPAGVLLNDSLSERELRQICAALQQRLEGRVWLSSKEALVDEATAASILAGSGSSSGCGRHSSSSSSDKLMYQVVLDAAAGRVLGVSPCTPEAAAAVWELPLAIELRGSKLAKVQERRAKAVAEAIQGKPSKNPPPSTGSQISYSRARQQPLPANGAVAVLKLLLTPAALRDTPAVTAAAVTAEPGSNSGAQQQQQKQWPPSVVVVGSGKAATAMWLMQAQVTPWNDDDSLLVWASKGAVLQQQAADAQQAAASSGATDTSAAAAAAAGVGGAGSGIALTVDGQEVQSMEAFVQQLIALSQQAQQAQQQQQ